MQINKRIEEMFPGEIYVLPPGCIKVQGIDKEGNLYVGMAINPKEIKSLLHDFSREVVGELEDVFEWSDNKGLKEIHNEIRQEQLERADKLLEDK